MIDLTTTITNVTPSVVPCYQCKTPVLLADAWPIQLLVPSGIYRNGKEMWRITDETAHVCDSCFMAETEDTLPKRLTLAEDGEWITPSWAHNSNGDDDEFITSGWQARTYDGKPMFKHKEKTVVQQWLADHGYIDMGDGHHYEQK